VVFVRERILFPLTFLKVLIIVIGLQDYFQMEEGSFSPNALIFALEELNEVCYMLAQMGFTM